MPNDRNQPVIDQNTHEAAIFGGGKSLALYVHWPFCRSKCPYCDFNSHVRDAVDQTRWRDGLLRELEYFANVTNYREIGSIFFGGGTPSLMPPATVTAIIDAASSHWRFAGDVEITLEANPTSVEARKFADLRAAGVNRVSLGVQSLNDKALAFLGREHSAEDAKHAISLSQRIFPRSSFDLIYALPDQTSRTWRRELTDALNLVESHLSVYQLTIEKGTPFHGDWRRGDWATPEEAIGAELFEVTRDILSDAGLPAYEISNHARPGEESRHNMAYWLSRDYIGIGPGAHGRLAQNEGAMAFDQHRTPETWLEAVETQGHGTKNRISVSANERLEEALMMGLRLSSGIPHDEFMRITGNTVEAALDAARLNRLIEGDFIELDKAGLRATPAGLMRLDSVLGALLG
jgi:putative oxygen-independent coproporphyrinogen III oxidase